MKILIVDDSVANLQTAKIQFAGHDVELASNFSEAKKLLSDNTFDVVMTDVMMPGEGEGQSPDGKRFTGELMPIGLVVALLALRKGIAKIFILSDTNHHNHPIAWAMDQLNGGERIRSYTGYSCPLIEDHGTKNWKAALERTTSLDEEEKEYM